LIGARPEVQAVQVVSEVQPEQDALQARHAVPVVSRKDPAGQVLTQAPSYRRLSSQRMHSSEPEHSVHRLEQASQELLDEANVPVGQLAGHVPLYK